jgi:hypothetical protein
MLFVIFIILVSAMSLFHRREHVMFIEELRALQTKLADRRPDAVVIKSQLKDEDWRLVRLDGGDAHLKRAFNPKGRDAVLRYAVPVALIGLTLACLASVTMAGIYFVLLCVKWFASVTVLDLSPASPRYEVRLGKFRLFGESLTEEVAKKK